MRLASPWNKRDYTTIVNAGRSAVQSDVAQAGSGLKVCCCWVHLLEPVGNKCLATMKTKARKLPIEVVTRAMSTESSRWNLESTCPDCLTILKTALSHQILRPITVGNSTILNQKPSRQ